MDIHISTQMSNDVRGAIIKTQKGIEILLNAKWAKRAEDVYQTLAHELAHFKYPNIHSKEWDAEAKRILEYLKTKGGEQDEEE
ncbi:MAG: hypothetical protein J7J52_04730 [Deltaproteobacteria bacterium]|nr:hypothetical protein [Deltaproteobacteria bacterium]